MKKFFLVNSSNLEYCNDSSFKKLKNLFISYLFGTFIIILVILVILNPIDLLLTKYFHFESILKLISQSHKNIIAYPFYIMIFIGPFTEEILFRLGLKLTKFNISIFIGSIFYLLLGGKTINFDIQNQFLIYYIVISFIISVISYLYFPSKILDFLNKKKNWLITISIFLFGLLHILNIKILHWQLLFLYPFFVLPQIIMGYFITNLRLKYGFVWGFFLHAFFNTINLLISHP
jgi:membrane protease YdiL (CAAX protease family)